MEPYYQDEQVTLYLGDCRAVIPALGLKADCIVADPPYGETSLTWDRWPDGWPTAAAQASSSLWCFGSMRMFLERRDEFTAWRLSQDVVWRKQCSTTFVRDRFARVHEHVLHWYRGPWSGLHHESPREPHYGRRNTPRHGYSSSSKSVHGELGSRGPMVDDGTRAVPSVMQVNNLRHGNQPVLHPTEKPVGILDPLIRYACPPGGVVLDPFAGSGSTAVAARLSGRSAVLIEGHEPYCEAIVRRLQQDVLPLEAM